MIFFESKSTLATPLFSCSVTQAVLESAEIVIYSGSISFAKSLVGLDILKPFAFSAGNWLLNELKFKVVTA